MSARYYVLVSQELLDSGAPWETAGLHLVEQGSFTEPGMRWCLFADDGAPEELNGKKVDLTLEAVGGVPGSARITDRRVVG